MVGICGVLQYILAAVPDGDYQDILLLPAIKRSNVIIERSLTSALKINKPWFAVFNHHITTLEVTIHKSGRRTTKQNIAHLLEIIFQFILLKLHAGSLEKTVFKVIQVPRIERWLNSGWG